MRAPFQILVLPFRREGGLQFAVFQRADDGSWQGIAGGGEDDESAVEAARREAEEEAGIPRTAALHRLAATSTVPVTCFAEHVRSHWPRDLAVLPEHAFAVDSTGIDIVVSTEHTAFEWADVDRANALLRWDSNKDALWELHRRLSRGVMPPPV